MDSSLAIAITSTGLEAARYSRSRGKLRLLSSETAPLPAPGTAGDSDGSAKESAGADAPQHEAVAAARHARPRSQEPFTLCVESRSALFQRMALPTTDPGEIASMAETLIEARLPLPLEEMAVSTETIYVDEVNTHVIAAAAPIAAIEAPTRRAELDTDDIVRVDVAAFAAARLLLAAGAEFCRGREAVLWEEASGVTLLLFDDGALSLVRPLADGVPLVRSIGLSLLQAEAECGPLPLRRVSAAAASGDSALPARAADLAAALRCELRSIDRANLGTAAQGAALRSCEDAAFNLLPAPWAAAKDEHKFRHRLFSVCEAAAAVWLLCALFLYAGPAAIDYKTKQTRERSKALDRAAKVVSTVRDRVQLIERYGDRSFSALEILREVSERIPPGIELSSFSHQNNERGRKLVVSGSAPSPSDVYSFKDAIDESALFSESRITKGPDTNKKTNRADFDLTVEYGKTEDELDREAIAQKSGGK